MFGKSIDKPEDLKGKVSFNIKTIPPDFYAGVSPVVKFKKVIKEVEIEERRNVLTPKEKEDFEKKIAKGGDKILHPANLFTNRKFLAIAGVVIFLLFVAGASVYYWYQGKNAGGEITVYVPEIEQKVTSTGGSKIDTNEVKSTTTTIKDKINNNTGTEEPAVDFPSMFLGYADDLDNDKLSDKEEGEIYGSDSGFSDSDEDDYTDGHEVYYLYNPSGNEPRRLIDSGKVKNYENPKFGYTIYYPASWSIGNVDSEYRTVLFSALSGDNIEIRVFDLETTQTFDTWFSKWALNEKTEDLEDFVGVFEQKGKRRKDELVYYFVDSQNKNIYLLIYHSGASGVVNFRATITMMARSLYLADNTFVKKWPVVDVVGFVSSTVLSTTTTYKSATKTEDVISSDGL